MRGAIAKKIRKYSKKNWIEYVKAMEGWPYLVRLRMAWHFINPFKELKRRLKKKCLLEKR